MKNRGVHPLTLALTSLILIAVPVSAGDLGPLEPLADLHRAVRESLGLPEPQIVKLLEQGVPDLELPVVGFLARELGRAPEEIAELHRSGLTFLDIALRFDKGPELFYVPFERDPGPPYGKAWGYYKKTPRAQWRTIRLSDDEIVDFVNLRVAKDYYEVPLERLVRLRRSGKDFGAIHRELSEETGRGHGRGRSEPPGKTDKNGKGKAKGKGKGGGGGPEAARRVPARER